MKNGMKRVLSLLLAVLLVTGTAFSDAGLTYQVHASDSGTQDLTGGGDDNVTPTPSPTPTEPQVPVNNSVSFQVKDGLWNAIANKYTAYGITFSKSYVTWIVKLKSNGAVQDTREVIWGNSESGGKKLTLSENINVDSISVSLKSLSGFNGSWSEYAAEVSADPDGKCVLSEDNSQFSTYVNGATADTSGFSMSGDNISNVEVNGIVTFDITVPEIWSALSPDISVADPNVAEVVADPAQSNKVTVKGKALGDTVLTVTWKKTDGTAIHQIVRNISVGTDTPAMNLAVTPDNVEWGENRTLTVTASAPEGVTADIYNGRTASLTYCTGSAPGSDITVGSAVITNGTVSFDLTISSGSVESYTFKLAIAESTTHRAVTCQSSAYTLAKQEQAFSVTPENDISVTYGDFNKKIARVESKSGNGGYSVVYTDNQGNLLAESAVAALNLGTESNGTIPVLITPKKSGTVYYRVKRAATDDYNEALSEVMSVTIAPKVLNLTAKAADRKYNAETTVNVIVSVASDGLVSGDVLTTSEWSVEGTVENGNAETGKAVTVPLKEVKLSEEDAAKYKLADSLSEEPKVTISKKPVEILVGNDEVEHTKVAIEYVDAMISYEGYLNGDLPVTVPDLELKLPANTSAGMLGEGTYASVICAAQNSGNPGNNYVFDYENQSAGALTVVAETVDNSNDYIKVNNTSSEQVYQDDQAAIYYRKAVSTGDTKAKFELPADSIYKNVFLVNNNGTQDDITEGFEFPLNTEDSQLTYTFKLTNGLTQGEEGYKSTKNFTLVFDEDADGPDIDIKIAEKKSLIQSFISTITFGIFSKTSLVANVTVNDALTDTFSGIKEFSYCVVNTNEDADFDSEKITKDNVTSRFAGHSFSSVSGTNTAEITIGENLDKTVASNQYIVFVYAEDQVGNSTLYSSQGMVIDNIGWKPNELSVVYGADTEEVNKDDFFNKTVNLDVTANPVGDQVYSGVKSIDYTVEQDGISGESENLFTQEKSDLTIEELQTEIKESLSVVAPEVDSHKVTVTVNAEDMSGNKTSAQKNFVIDTMEPEITSVEYVSDAEGYEHGDTVYYGDAVTLKTVITERFLDAGNDVKVTVDDHQCTLKDLITEVDANGNPVYEVKINGEILEKENADSLTDIQGADDDTETTVEITFKPDGNYEIGGISVTDMAGNKTEKADETVKRSITIDREAPVVSVLYNKVDKTNKVTVPFEAAKTDEDGKTAYENSAYIQAVITVKEKNFDKNGWKDFDLQVSGSNSADESVDVKQADINKVTDEKTDTHTYTVVYKTDARYSLNVQYKDLAGNPAVFMITDDNGENTTADEYETDYFTIDHTNPNGTITVGNLVNISSDDAFDKDGVSDDQKTKSWINKFLDAVNPLRWFGKESVTVTAETSDATSGVKAVAYYVTNEVKTLEDLSGLYEDEATRSDWQSSPENMYLADQNVIIYQRVEDYAGNVAYYRTDKVTVDNTNSENNMSIAVEPKIPARNKGIYIDTEIDKFVINVTDPAPKTDEDAFAGLRKVTYTLSDNNRNQLNKGETILKEYTSQSHISSDKYEVKIPTTKDYSCDLTIEVTALDWSDNTYTTSKTITIDPIAPVVTLTEDQSASEKNGKYYSENVILTTEITERYLDIEEDVYYTINGSRIKLKDLIVEKADYGIKLVDYTQDTTDKDKDNAKSVVKIEFEEDDDYRVSVDVVDKAGNTGKSNECEFVIDHKDPVLNVTYIRYNSNEQFSAGKDNGHIKYLGEDNTSFRAVITVNEHNFFTDEEKVDNDSYLPKFTVKATDAQGKTILSEVTANYADLAKTAGRWGSDNEQSDVRTFYVDITNDGNYTFDFSYTDLAGRSAVVTTDYITLDRVRPTGTVSVDGMVNGDSSRTWVSYFLNGITFGLFGQNGLGSTMTSNDVTAGVQSTQYIATSQLLTRDDLKKRTDWNAYHGRIGLGANQNVVVYEKVVDKAGNTEYFSTDNLVADNTDPAPVVTITPSSPSWGKGVYSAGDNPGFDVRVTDPEVNRAYSGLKEITYQIVNGTTGATETGTLASIGREQHQQTWTGHVSINPERFYSNDVRITVSASDWSTNDAVSETATLKIDNKAPIVRFSFDKSDVQNGKYYKNNKTLTITVDERNFDQSYIPKVTSTAGGGYSFNGWSTNGEITTGTVTFSGDSDYTVTFDCYDLAGNKSNTETLEEFTVDKTNPTISVSYDNDSVQNGSYYKASRTATITINEHNFRAGDVRVTTTASNGSAPSVSGWSGSGDRHTATVYFGSDADYTFDIEYTDLAGNGAADYDQDKFTVDLTKPVLEITGVANKSANKGTVAPVIRISDTNFIANGVTLTLKGVNKGNVSTDGMVTRATANDGQTITFLNFGANMDDIYTLTAKSVDKAGNETTKSITFSVNRDGSAYTINDSAKKLLEKGFTNNPKDIVITETNVDTLEFIQISISRNGEIIKLTEGTDYTVKAEGGDGQWKKYTYTIFAKCFEEEGEYSINISSTDRAENVSNNKAQSMDVDFIVDKTAPVMAISNLEDRGRYKENSHEYTLNVKDNAMLVSVQIYLDGELYKTYELVNGKLVNTEDPNDVLEMDNGKVYLSVDSKNAYQTIKLVTTDAAGNVSETEDYNVLVTSSNWVQFYMNKPLFFGCIAAIVVVCGLIFFIIWKKKKEEEEKQTRARR